MQVPTLSKDMDDKSKLTHEAVDVAERPNKKISVILLQYNVEKPGKSSAKSQLVT